MTDLVYGKRKSKMIALRIDPEIYKKLVDMTEQYRATDSWYSAKKTVSKTICMAIEDFINGNQKYRKEFEQAVKKKKK